MATGIMGMPSLMRMVISSWPRSMPAQQENDKQQDGSAYFHYFSHSNSKWTTRYCEEKSLGRGAKGAAFSMARRADRSREAMPLGMFHPQVADLAVAADDEINAGDVFPLQPGRDQGTVPGRGYAVAQQVDVIGMGEIAAGPAPDRRPSRCRCHRRRRRRRWKCRFSAHSSTVLPWAGVSLLAVGPVLADDRDHLFVFDFFPAFSVGKAQRRLEFLFHRQVLDAAAFFFDQGGLGRRAPGLRRVRRPPPPPRRRHRRRRHCRRRRRD